jgi:hypothetical protein
MAARRTKCISFPKSKPVIRSSAMKNPVLFVCAILILSSCNKYPDGPEFSLATKTMRLTNTWVVNTFIENDTDKTAEFMAQYVEYKIYFDMERTYALHYYKPAIGKYDETGTWDYNKRKTAITLKKDVNAAEATWNILRLQRKELWVSYTGDDGETCELHLVPKM